MVDIAIVDARYTCSSYSQWVSKPAYPEKLGHLSAEIEVLSFTIIGSIEIWHIVLQQSFGVWKWDIPPQSSFDVEHGDLRICRASPWYRGSHGEPCLLSFQ